MTRLLLIVAVLLACLTWPCSAEADKTETDNNETEQWKERMKKEMEAMKARRNRYVPPPDPRVFFWTDIPDVMDFVEMAQEKLELAKSAKNLLESTATPDETKPFDPMVDVTNSRKRAENAMKLLNTTQQGTSTIAKMAAKVAQEMYDNETAGTLLIEEHMRSFTKRYENATSQEASLTKAIPEMKSRNRQYPGMHPLIMAVLTPAMRMDKSAEDAINDVKYIVSKRIFTDMLAERIESLQEFAKNQSTDSAGFCANDGNNKGDNANNAAEVSKHRDAAAKAYLSAASAQKIAAACITRIKGNTTKVEATYYEVRELLARVRRTDYAKMRVYQSIAAAAHADAEECEQIAAGTPDYAAAFAKTAKAHLDSIALSCANAAEAKWHAGEAQKASQKALNEMQFAVYQLFRATMSLQQAADAKKSIEESESFKAALEDEAEFNKLPTASITTEKAVITEEEEEKGEKAGKNGMPRRFHMPRQKTPTEIAREQGAVREAKKKAVASEREAEKSYAAVKAHANMAANTVLHVADIVSQIKKMEAQAAAAGTDNDKNTKIKEELEKAQTALKSANESSIKAQAAAAAVYDIYNKTKNDVDYALYFFEQTVVDHWQSAADNSSKSAKEKMTGEEAKGKSALGEVEKQKDEAWAAYNATVKLVETIGKTQGFEKFSLQAARTSDLESERNSAAVSSLLHVSVAVLCAVAALVLDVV